MKYIRRYNNRKFYSHQDCKYVTLAELSQFLSEGQVFVVKEHGTNLEITDATVMRIFKWRVAKVPASEVLSVTTKFNKDLEKFTAAQKAVRA